MRHRLLALTACVALVILHHGSPRAETTTPVSAEPIAALLPFAADRTRFGGLTFLRGSVLTSPDERFGGISSLTISEDGDAIIAVTDAGVWLTAALTTDTAGTLTLGEVRLEPIRGIGGRRLTGKRDADAEALAEVPGKPGHYLVGFERNDRILAYDFSDGDLTVAGTNVPIPDAIHDLPRNKGVEALVALPADGNLPGAIIAIAERAGPDRIGPDRAIAGFILGGPAPGAFRLQAYDSYDITDAALAPDGDILLLERFFSVVTGPYMAVRRIDVADIADGATIRPQLVGAIDVVSRIDNMEALGVHEDAEGRTVLTLMSDDNFNALQHTVLLQFLLEDNRLD